jgi:hypothetical protein
VPPENPAPVAPAPAPAPPEDTAVPGTLLYCTSDAGGPAPNLTLRTLLQPGDPPAGSAAVSPVAACATPGSTGDSTCTAKGESHAERHVKLFGLAAAAMPPARPQRERRPRGSLEDRAQARPRVAEAAPPENAEWPASARNTLARGAPMHAHCTSSTTCHGHSVTEPYPTSPSLPRARVAAPQRDLCEASGA